jgi:outer membrane protein assembly factor BamB
LIFLALVTALLLSSCAGGAASRGSTWPGLAADAQMAYLSDGAQLFAIRLSDHAEMWRYPGKPDSKVAFYATPALLGDGRLLIGSAGTDHCLYLIDTTQLTQVDETTKTPAATCVFSGAKDHWVAAPLVIGDAAYAPNNDGFLYAVDFTAKQLLWSLQLGGGGHLWATPTTDGQTLFVSSLDHFLYAVDLGSQKILWKSDLAGSVPSSPALSADGKTLFVGSFASKAFALDAATGKVMWTTDTQNWAWGSPAVNESTVYVGDVAGQLYALDSASGKIAWSLQPDGPITGSPLVSEDLIIVTTESGSVYAFDAQGKHAWDALIKGKIYTPAVRGGDLILVAPLSTGAEFFLTALHPDGSVAWNFKPE